MPHEVVDRRVGRTQRALKKALLDLIQERPYEEITVRDISDRADIGRSTFYSHFDSKEALLFHGFDHFLMSMAERPLPGPTAPPASTKPLSPTGPPAPAAGKSVGFRFSLPLLDHIRSQRKFFLATIVEASDSRVRRRTTDLLARLVRSIACSAKSLAASASSAPQEGVSKKARFLGL